MKFHKILPLVMCASFLFLLAGCGGDSKSEAAPKERNAQDVVNGMRLKQLIKGLELTDDQQAKVKAMYDDEAKEMNRINDDTNLSVDQHFAKIDALKKETSEKIKPLLTPPQLEKFEQMAKKVQRKKKV